MRTLEIFFGLYLEDYWVDWHGFLRDAYGVLQLLESQWDCNVSNLHL